VHLDLFQHMRNMIMKLYQEYQQLAAYNEEILKAFDFFQFSV
jgi:hypothetical protein